MAQALGIADILDRLREQTSGDDVKLGDVVEMLENRGFGPLLLAPALLALLPTGFIPGVPSLCGIVIFLIALQRVLGKKHPWLPALLRERSIGRDALLESIAKARPYAKKFDRLLKPRLLFLTEEPFDRAVALACGLLGLSMIPLELVPFAAALPGLAIALTSVGLSSKDGLLLSAAAVLLVGSFYLLITRWPL